MSHDSSPSASAFFLVCVFAILSMATLVLLTLTSLLATRVCLEIGWKHLEFYHSSESRGLWHISLYSLLTFVLGDFVLCAVSVLRFRHRLGIASRRSTFRYMARSFATLWLVLSVALIFVIAFYELPYWEQVRGG